MPRQCVLFPHSTTLTSHPAAFDRIEKEICKLEAHRLAVPGSDLHSTWVEFFPGPAFYPCRANPQGAAARKLEPQRPRRTSDAGAPRKETRTAAGELVPSHNERIAIREKNKWSKEVKPTTTEKAQAGYILTAAARLLGEERPPGPERLGP